MDFRFPVLIGDIGGTNARFAMVLADGAPLQRFSPVQLRNHPSIEDAIETAVLGKGAPAPATMVLAIATPLVGERFRLTNADWMIDPAEMIARFNLEQVVLMNDFAAQGLAALALDPEHLHPIGAGNVMEGHPKAVLGPGTGLGIAQIVKVDSKWAIIPGEGGHIDIGPRTPREFAIWPHLAKQDDRMSAEEALSGRGIENLYQAICALDGVAGNLRDAAEISAKAVSADNPQASEAIRLFVALAARVAGDMALLTLARGGVYIAGGIAQKLISGIETDFFRQEFENKAPHRAIMAQIAVNILTHPTAALEGLAALVREPGNFSLGTAARVFLRK